MDPLRASMSALGTSLLRAIHTRLDRPPLIDDPYGDRLVSDAERAFLLERILLTLSAEARETIQAVDRERALQLAAHATPAYGGVLVRARYTEEKLARAVDQ